MPFPRNRDHESNNCILPRLKLVCVCVYLHLCVLVNVHHLDTLFGNVVKREYCSVKGKPCSITTWTEHRMIFSAVISHN